MGKKDALFKYIHVLYALKINVQAGFPSKYPHSCGQVRKPFLGCQEKSPAQAPLLPLQPFIPHGRAAPIREAPSRPSPESSTLSPSRTSAPALGQPGLLLPGELPVPRCTMGEDSRSAGPAGPGCPAPASTDFPRRLPLWKHHGSPPHSREVECEMPPNPPGKVGGGRGRGRGMDSAVQSRASPRPLLSGQPISGPKATPMERWCGKVVFHPNSVLGVLELWSGTLVSRGGSLNLESVPS